MRDSRGDTTRRRLGARASLVAQTGALASAVVASACCWLPLLLLAFGVSGGAFSTAFEAWRPVLLPATFLLLGAAFYLTYRKPKTDDGEACCPPTETKRFTLRRANRIMLWVMTPLVLAFAFFPNYAGSLLGGSGDVAPTAPDESSTLVVAVEGMTCEACAASLEKTLGAVPGVSSAHVSYAKGEAVLVVPRGTEPERAVLEAVSRSGYSGRLVEQVSWTLNVEGMTCRSCAAPVEAALSEVPGVFEASVSYERGRAEVTAAPTVEEGALVKAVEGAGYAVSSARRTSGGKRDEE